MLRQLSAVMGLGILVAGCSGTDSDEAPAAQESLSMLRAPAPRISSRVRTTLTRAASRLCDLQADRVGDPARNGLTDDDPDDGGWDWLDAPSSSAHSTDASPENLYGAVALGVWSALQAGAPRERLQLSLLNTAFGSELNAAVDSPPDFVFLSQASEALHRQRYADLARERYDARIASAGDATALAISIRDGRHASGADGLIPYDLAWLALGALSLNAQFPHQGYRADFASIVRVVLDDVSSSAPNFDYRDSSEAFYVQGLAWSFLVASWDPSSHALFVDLRSRLLAAQLANGAFPYSGDFPDAHLQATAHALMALGLTRHGQAAPRDVSDRAASWLMSQQAANGGWAYSASEEYPLLDAEIALGVYLSETAVGAREGVVPDDAPGRAGFALSESSGLPPLAAPEALP